VAFDTDVNAAALGEFQWGASRGLDPSLYLTVGTGIGGGLIKDGKPMNGLLHPEMGHIRIPHDLVADPFPGSCPYHGDCFEGLANGPAIQKRFGQRGETIPDDDPFWKIEAGYIALALHNLILTLTPRRIILGGGILQRSFLFPLIRQKVIALLNGYVQHTALLQHIDDYIVPPALGGQSGVMGAIALAATLNRDL
jgi:fructokinase